MGRRTEFMAVCKAVEVFTNPLMLVSDSQHVAQTRHKTQRSRRCPSKHSDLWSYLVTHMGRVVSARWIKAHVSSARKARTLGVSIQDWKGNRVAGQLAKAGVLLHPTDPVIHDLYQRRFALVRSIQRRMLLTWE